MCVDNVDSEVVPTVRSATATTAHAVGHPACRPLLDVASSKVCQQLTSQGDSLGMSCRLLF